MGRQGAERPAGMFVFSCVRLTDVSDVSDDQNRSSYLPDVSPSWGTNVMLLLFLRADPQTAKPVMTHRDPDLASTRLE